MQLLAFQLLTVIVVACLRCNNHVQATLLSGIHVEPSQQQIRTGDAYNVSCWFETLATLQAICGSIDNLYMQTHANENLTLHPMNATGVFHTVISAKPQHTNSINSSYECLCRGKSLKSARFMIGVRFAVTDFNCFYRDYLTQAALECSFSKPPLSDNVDDKAEFMLQHNNQRVECLKQPNNDTRMQCNISKYNKFAKSFNFTLRMRDKLGEQPSLNFTLTKEQCIVLKQPGGQHTRLNGSSDAICINWIDNQLSNHIGYNISWSVELLPHYSSTWNWRVQQTLNKEIFCLEHLPYPHHNYTVILKRRYDSIDARWSEPFVYNFSTEAALPQRPPKVWPGGYHLDAHRSNDLFVYWQQLHQLEYNGPQFTYNVSIRHINNNNNSIPINYSKIDIESNRAIIRNLTMTHGSYKVIIHSQNAVGMSENSSEIIAVITPHESYKRRIPKNLKISKTANTFSWEPPEQQQHLLGYTIYWCTSNITDRSSCNDTLAIESKQISIASQCHFHSPMAALDTFEWAVSADYESGVSGGMHWLEWYHGSGFGNAANAEQSDTLHSLEGILAIVVIGFCVYALIRKFRYMSDINVEIPEGVLKQQELQAALQLQPNEKYTKSEDLDAVPLMGSSQSRRSSPVDIPLVLNGNFKPLAIDAVTPATTYTPVECNVNYVTMKPQKPLQELANPPVTASASGYVPMLSSHPNNKCTSEYVPAPMYR